MEAQFSAGMTVEGLNEREAGVSRPPAPCGPEGTPARIRLSHRLAVRAGAPSGTGADANDGADYGVG